MLEDQNRQEELRSRIEACKLMAGGMVAMAFFGFSGAIEQAMTPGNDR